ncbi:MAG: peptide chain release factor 1 [Oscillospiraceae bacterium]|nr:peptide chain release factor 1 [Oscillospiraceae bacterium]
MAENTQETRQRAASGENSYRERYHEIETRYREIEARLSQKETYADKELLSSLNRSRKELEPLRELYGRCVEAEARRDEAGALLGDRELGELAREEWNAAREELKELEKELAVLLTPTDPLDEKNVIMEIRAGVGGEESALFAGELYRMYSMYAQKKGWNTEIANLSENEKGGVKEIDFVISGRGAYSHLKYESGVHRVQRVPETETQGRIHTSTATVAVLPEMDETEFELNLNEVQIDTFRSSGAGGQKVNKTSSAIRVTHLPTGTVVECQDERSQYKNKARALSILSSRLAQAERERQDAQVSAERRSQVGSGMRNERIRTYNFPQGRVTDHRVNLTLYKIDSVMDGELDELIAALRAAEQTEKLKEV